MIGKPGLLDDRSTLPLGGTSSVELEANPQSAAAITDSYFYMPCGV